MYLIINSLYPRDTIKEVVNVYGKMMTKYPDNPGLATPIVQVAVKSTQDGINVIHISEIKKGKLDDAIMYASTRMAMFNDIQGYKWTIKTYLNMEEALKTVGM